jgi:hypothetical protein
MVYELRRVSAAGILLDRGWGRTPQPHREDGKDARITIRQIIEGGSGRSSY